MVEHLQHYGVISSKKVAEVMETVDRALFVPDGNPPYLDTPMAIGYNATISAPHMHATCLQLLEENLQPGMRALDVGSGVFFALPFAFGVNKFWSLTLLCFFVHLHENFLEPFFARYLRWLICYTLQFCNKRWK